MDRKFWMLAPLLAGALLGVQIVGICVSRAAPKGRTQIETASGPACREAFSSAVGQEEIASLFELKPETANKLKSESPESYRKLVNLAHIAQAIRQVPDRYWKAVDALAGVFDPEDQLKEASELVDPVDFKTAENFLSDPKIKSYVEETLSVYTESAGVTETENPPGLSHSISKLTQFLKNMGRQVPSLMDLVAHSRTARQHIIQLYIDTVLPSGDRPSHERLERTLTRELEGYIQTQRWDPRAREQFRRYILNAGYESDQQAFETVRLALIAVMHQFLWVSRPSVEDVKYPSEFFDSVLAFLEHDEIDGPSVRPFLSQALLTALTALRPQPLDVARLLLSRLRGDAQAVVRDAAKRQTAEPEASQVGHQPEVVDDLTPFIKGTKHVSDLIAGKSYHFRFLKPIAGYEGQQSVSFTPQAIREIAKAYRGKNVPWWRWLEMLRRAPPTRVKDRGRLLGTMIKLTSSPWNAHVERKGNSWVITGFDEK